LDRIAAGPASDRRDLFTEAAGRLGMNPAIVEKDFWVCWILKRLFSEPELQGQMVFKGGTSLSKVYSLIDRFSEDPHTVNVGYPAAFSAGYIRPQVRLEIGPLASWVPSSSRTIRSYAAEAFPQAFVDPICVVVAIDAERAFWEKATILHQEAHRAAAIPARYSRHYYDMYKLANSPIKNSALSDLVLLKDVVEFKERFYYSSWAQ
jgi:predicted nucleotidyltransferase component of viral defense system